MQTMTLSRTSRIAALLVAALAPMAAHAQAKSTQLTAVLSQMDSASAKFKTAEASFQWDYYEKIVHDTSTDKGSIFFERTGSSTAIGAVLSGPDGKPKQVIAFSDNTLENYTPGNSQLQVFNAGSSGSTYLGFLALGFGGSGTDLVKSWTVTDGGPETLTIEGQKTPCEKLNLIPKEAGMAKNFKNVVMWVDTTRGIGVREIFYTNGGDYRTATYSNIHLNGKIDKAKYGIGANNKVKTAKGTQVFNH